MTNRFFMILLCIAVLLLATVAYLYTLPGASEPGAGLHPLHNSLLKSNERTVPNAAYLLGYLFIGFAGCMVMVGSFKKDHIGSMGRMLLVGIGLYLLVYTGLIVSYMNYEPGPDAGFFGGLPTPTAWMMYGIWGFPVLLVLVFIIYFDSWFVTEADMQTFQRLLDEQQDHQGGA